MLDLSKVFAAFPTLETQRCLLREARPDDAPDIFRFMSDARVTRYIGQQPMTSLEQAEKRVQSFQTYFQEQRAIPWVIVQRATGNVIGTYIYWNILPEHFRAEIGYILDPAWWGQGLMTEVVAATLEFGFRTMGLNSIEAQTDPGNAASSRVLEKLGFVKEGHFREYYYDPTQGKFTDKVVFSLLKSNWAKRVHL
jgi:ribosomal-protein-alanine N-acetyltransferase